MQSKNNVSIQINLRTLTLYAACAASLLAGFLIGWVIFGRPQLSTASLPTEALVAAQGGGELILTGIVPNELGEEYFTPEFLTQYETNYAAFIRPMSTQGTIEWVGTPVVTWQGANYTDVSLTARTDSGVVALELRLTRASGDWKISNLLAIQLREEVK